MTDEDKKYTPWYRIENTGRDYRVIVWKHKQPPEMVEGTEVYRSPVEALNAILQVVGKDLLSWE